MGKAHLITFGCQMNKFDSERLTGVLTDAGYQMTDDPEYADVIIFNTCCVRESADDRLYGRLGQLLPAKERRPDLLIAVGGCLAQKDKDIVLDRAPHVDVVFGTHNSSELPQMLDEAAMGHSIIRVPIETGSAEEQSDSEYRQERVRAWLPITVGCDNFCTYCIVPKVRGRERSVPMGTLIARAKELRADGVVDLTLLGQNVNSYGRDLYGETKFGELLEALDESSGIPRIRFATSHPKDFSDRIIETIANSNSICPQIHLPFQAGSNRILGQMKRGYDREWYMGRVEQIRSAMPGAAVSTDVIVGFPGETEEEFLDTLDLMRTLKFDGAYTFIYSPRSGTPAAKMADEVPAEISAERMGRLLDMQYKITTDKNREYVGRTVEALVEGVSKKDDSKLTGRTKEGKLIHFAGGFDLIDTLVDVEVTAAHTWYLEGVHS